MKTLRQLLAVALVLTTGSLAAAQTFTGGVRGAVKDANGVIPGVTVQLINEATGQSREAVSNVGQNRPLCAQSCPKLQPKLARTSSSLRCLMTTKLVAMTVRPPALRSDRAIHMAAFPTFSGVTSVRRPDDSAKTVA